jgi:Lipocalin-like domain
MIESLAARRFIGVWRLESIRDRFPGGREEDHPDFGPDPDGFIVYTGSGHVSVQFMRGGRTAWRDEGEPTTAELAQAARGFGAYAGRYEVDETAGTVLHHVETALIPNRVGVTLKRSFSFEGERLTLAPPPLRRGNVEVERTLVWRRIA